MSPIEQNFYDFIMSNPWIGRGFIIGFLVIHALRLTFPDKNRPKIISFVLYFFDALALNFWGPFQLLKKLQFPETDAAIAKTAKTKRLKKAVDADANVIVKKEALSKAKKEKIISLKLDKE